MKRPEDSYLNEPLPPVRRERGTVLGGWLIFLGIANALGVIRSVESGNLLFLGWSVFGVICVLGLWNWYKWAFYGLLIGFVFNLAVNLDSRSVSGVIYQLVFIGLTYFLVQPKLDDLK